MENPPPLTMLERARKIGAPNKEIPLPSEEENELIFAFLQGQISKEQYFGVMKESLIFYGKKKTGNLYTHGYLLITNNIKSNLANGIWQLTKK